MLFRILHLAFLSFVPLFLASSAAAVDHVWSKSFGDVWPQTATGVAPSSGGHIVLCGNFMSSIDLGGFPLNSAGEYDVFLAALGSDGQHLWSWRFGDYDNDKVRDLGVDEAGNIVLVGDFFSDIFFGGDILSSNGDKDVFVASFNALAQHLWSASFGDPAYDSARCVSYDRSGNVVIAGHFRGEIDLGGGPLDAGDGQDLFLLKLDAAGAHLWSASYGEFGQQWAFDVATDANEEILLAGATDGAVDFGGGLLVSIDGQDAFLARFTPDGEFLWSRASGGDGDECAVAVAADGDGDAVIAGHFEQSIDLGGGVLQSAGASDLFLARYDRSGAYLWSRRFGDEDAQEAGDLAVGLAGMIGFTGAVAGAIDFGGGVLVSAGASDLCLALFDEDGEHAGSALYGDEAEQWGDALAIEPGGGLILAASFAGVLDLGGGPLTSAGSFDVALARMSPRISAVPDPPRAAALACHPNPFNPRARIRFSLEKAGPAHLKIFMPDGRLAASPLDGALPAGEHEVVWEAGNLPSGVYIARLETAGRRQFGKLVLLK